MPDMGNILPCIFENHVFSSMEVFSMEVSRAPPSLREFVLNYRHPGPRRVWKDQQDLADPGDPLDPGYPRLCPKVWFSLRKTILFPIWPALDRLRHPDFLRKIKTPAGLLNTKTEFLRGEKAPAGLLNTKTEFLRGKKSPCGVVKYQSGVVEENKSPCGHVQNTFRF